MSKTIVGLFDDKTEAQKVMQDVVQIGIPRTETAILDDPAPASGMAAGRSHSDREPGVWDSLKQALGFGLTEDESRDYLEGMRRGGTIVSVRADDTRVDRVLDIMEEHGAVDIEERSAQWRQTAGSTVSRAPEQGQVTIPVVEEELQVGKREVQRGGVRVYSRVTDNPVEETVRLRDERVSVERRSVNRPLDQADMAALKDGAIEMTETDEEPVVSKRARVIEEIVIRKDVGERTEKIRDTVRRTDVDVQSLEGREAATAGTLATEDDDFRRHYDSTFANRGYTYDQYGPAYRYGSHLASDAKYGPSDWTVVEPEARRYWEERNEGTWEDFKDAIRHSWEQGRQKLTR
ncbi:MAG TPA: YsnF/AvaK domain-containing protein [Nitrospiraceae bacterium]|nr:YsnF/AvaK domain-containing protein [Nitrospiraceae bacterium]